MRSNRDDLSSSELRTYAALQASCWVMAGASFGVLTFELSIALKWVTLVSGVAFLLGAVIFNWARRFGIRVLWSRHFRQ